MNVKHPIFGVDWLFPLYPVVSIPALWAVTCVDHHLSPSPVININFCYFWIICFYFPPREPCDAGHGHGNGIGKLAKRKHVASCLTNIDQSHKQSTWLDFSHDTYKTRIYNRIFRQAQRQCVCVCGATMALRNYGQVEYVSVCVCVPSRILCWLAAG